MVLPDSGGCSPHKPPGSYEYARTAAHYASGRLPRRWHAAICRPCRSWHRAAIQALLEISNVWW